MEEFRALGERPFLTLLCAASRAAETGHVVLRDRDGDRHGVTLEAGYVRAVHVAGRHDPILSMLTARGLLDPATRARCLAALGDPSQRSGALAALLGQLPPPTLRDVIRAQQLARFAELLRTAEQRGHDARVEPCDAIGPDQGCVRLPVGTLLRALGHTPLPGATDEPRQPTPDAAAAAKRRLRAAARALHPDRHPHASPAERSALERALADATARYHGFGDVG